MRNNAIITANAKIKINHHIIKLVVISNLNLSYGMIDSIQLYFTEGHLLYLMEVHRSHID